MKVCEGIETCSACGGKSELEWKANIMSNMDLGITGISCSRCEWLEKLKTALMTKQT